MGKSRGTRIRRAYIAETDGVEISPSGSYIRLSDWGLDYETFLTLTDKSFVKESVNPKDKSKGKRYAEHDGQVFKVNGLRLSTFKLKGNICVECGLEGEVFRLEKPVAREPFHLNFYGYRDGNEVMLTQDHVKPKSRGGRDHIDNSQTMCKKCNESKGSKWTMELEDDKTYYLISNLEIRPFKVERVFPTEEGSEDFYLVQENTKGVGNILYDNVVAGYCNRGELTDSSKQAKDFLEKKLNQAIRQCNQDIEKYRKRIKSLKQS
jgi:hypothetical protein